MYEFHEATIAVAVRTADPRIRGDISHRMRYVAAKTLIRHDSARLMTATFP
jgi:hypothetical protein